jgi:hypothetical protein
VYTIYTHNFFAAREKNSEIFAPRCSNNNGMTSNDIGSDTYGVIQRYNFFLCTLFRSPKQTFSYLPMLRLRSLRLRVCTMLLILPLLIWDESDDETEANGPRRHAAKCSQDSDLNVIHFPSPLIVAVILFFR